MNISILVKSAEKDFKEQQKVVYVLIVYTINKTYKSI